MSVGTFSIRNICDKTQNKSVLPPYYRMHATDLPNLFCVLSQMLQLERVATKFILSNKGKVTRKGKTFFKIFLSKGGRL